MHDWLSDPYAAPHGGGSLHALSVRVGAWLDTCAAARQRTVVFAPAAVIRAALVHALGAPPAALMQFDVAPLSVTRLGRRGESWTWYLPPAR